MLDFVVTAPAGGPAGALAGEPPGPGAAARPGPGGPRGPRRPAKAPKRAKGTAVVGGFAFTVGGWGAYEAERRRAIRAAQIQARDAAGVPADCPCNRRGFYRESFYPSRTTLGGRDAAESLLGARGAPRALRKAAASLSASLGRLQDALCDPDEDGAPLECASAQALRGRTKGFPSATIPPLAAADVDAFMAEGSYADAEDLAELADSAIATAATLREYLKPPPALRGRPAPAVPARVVEAADDGEVARLEAAAVPYVAHIEELQAAVATILDQTSAAIDRRLGRSRAPEARD